MAKKLQVTKVLEQMTIFFDSKSVNVYQLSATIAAAPQYVQHGFFTVCVHYISIVADRGLEGHYVNDPVMESNSATARQMTGITMD